jgi:SOS-response transcriptional repressor LexA
MTIGEYLKARREGRDMSLRDASKSSGISHTNIKDIEDSKISPTFDKVIKLLNAYHADVQEFLQKTGHLNIELAAAGIFKRLPVISWVLAGKWEEVCNSFHDEDAEEWIESDAIGQNLFALRVKGDSMEPEFIEGDIIIVNPHLKATPGDYIVAKNDENEATFKQYKKYGDTRILHPLNSKYEDIVLKKDVEYRIVGVVIEKKKRYK